MIHKIKPFIFTGGRPSNSAKDLRHGLPARRLKQITKPGRLIINWGCTDTVGYTAQFVGATVWNSSAAVKEAANKLSAFDRLYSYEVPTVPYNISKAIAETWLIDSDVVVRHKLRGHSGDGIEIVKQGSGELPNAPLYTKYCPKKYEYRVHVMFNQVIDVIRKIRDPDREPLSWQIRSHDNGFIFARANLKHREQIEPIAIQAVQTLGLDFGAVDIIIDEKSHEPLVLEINTAPGLEGQTLQAYIGGFRAKISTLS